MTENVARLHRWFDEVWNHGREQTIDELMAADAVLHGLGDDGSSGIGPEAFKKFFKHFRSAITDIRLTVDDVVEQADQTVARLTLRGMHDGDGFGVGSSGRPVVVTGIAWGRWKNGQVAEAWDEFDAAGLTKQITGPAPCCVKA